MQTKFEKRAGIALIVFTILMIFTMVLHPAGGSIEYLLKITGMIMITHAIAILSLPFALVGFWGLTRRIGTDNFLSVTAFAFMAMGIVAVMMAASANGLVMPIFLEQYRDASPDTLQSLKPVLRYSFSINHAFDYIYTGGFCIAMMLWSIAILFTRKLPVWVAYLGIVISIGAIVLVISGIAGLDLMGFRIFVTSIILWIVAVGTIMARERF
jgi:hypothetical protein